VQLRVLVVEALAHDQHFANGIAGQEELDRSEVAEQGFDVAVVEYPLQARRLLLRGGTPGRANFTSCISSMSVSVT